MGHTLKPSNKKRGQIFGSTWALFHTVLPLRYIIQPTVCAIRNVHFLQRIDDTRNRRMSLIIHSALRLLQGTARRSVSNVTTFNKNENQTQYRRRGVSEGGSINSMWCCPSSPPHWNGYVIFSALYNPQRGLRHSSRGKIKQEEGNSSTGFHTRPRLRDSTRRDWYRNQLPAVHRSYSTYSSIHTLIHIFKFLKSLTTATRFLVLLIQPTPYSERTHLTAKISTLILQVLLRPNCDKKLERRG
jgi:hypothetical protein